MCRLSLAQFLQLTNVATQVTRFFFKSSPKTQLCQGDVLHDVKIPLLNNRQMEINNIEYCVVTNQECDLDLDYKHRISASESHDKFLPNIILLPAYQAQVFREGKHRPPLKLMEWKSKELWNGIIQNNNARFHCIKQNEAFQLPELIIDFKHCYTIDRDYLYSQINKVYYVSLAELFRESLSQRYCNYLSRIGLPDDNPII